VKKLSVICYLLSVLCIGFADAADYSAALVADMDTGQGLDSEHANDANYPASLTKIMTLYLTFDALEHGRLHQDDYLIVSQSAANAAPVKLGLAAGSKIRVEDAIKAVAVHSANDVARVLAENLKGGKEGNFASLMTQVASEIGLSKTNFENSSGLPDDDHLSSARDIALLAMATYKHFPQYWKYFGIKSWTYDGKTYNNSNRLLGSYPGCDGMKTGYTNKSKYSLVATARRDDRRVIAVVLGAKDKDVRANVAARMLDRGFGALGVKESGKWKVDSGNIEKPQTEINHESRITNYGAAAGRAGVQFGAFGSINAANEQAARAKRFSGVNASVEQSSGLFRVRAYGLSESAAQNACDKFRAQKLECFVFH
jgi:D-alanyl-D-alanine carboxypeptidase